MDKIKEALEFDAIYECEKVFGNKHHSEFTEEENKFSLGVFMLNNKRKEELLKEANDTHFGMTWDEFESIVTSNGFKIGYEERFPYEDHEEKGVIFYREDGLIIWATSFWNMKSVNGGTMYGEIKLNNVNDRCNIPQCSNGFYDYENGKLNFSTDIREGLIWFIKEMKKYGEFIPKFEEENKFLWFVNFHEDKQNGYDFEKISKEKMNKFSKEAKNIVENYL